jgi:hypothetical protein
VEEGGVGRSPKNKLPPIIVISTKNVLQRSDQDSSHYFTKLTRNTWKPEKIKASSGEASLQNIPFVLNTTKTQAI